MIKASLPVQFDLGRGEGVMDFMARRKRDK
jgi:hypothetical protein